MLHSLRTSTIDYDCINPVEFYIIRENKIIKGKIISVLLSSVFF